MNKFEAIKLAKRFIEAGRECRSNALCSSCTFNNGIQCQGWQVMTLLGTYSYPSIIVEIADVSFALDQALIEEMISDV